MLRLIVEAVSNEMVTTDSETKLSFTVSVSDANFGVPLTGLTKEAFKVTDLGIIGPMGNVDFKIAVTERVWDPGDSEKSGVYDLALTSPSFVTWNSTGPNINFGKGRSFAIGIQVIAPANAYNGAGAQGQTVVSIVNL